MFFLLKHFILDDKKKNDLQKQEQGKIMIKDAIILYQKDALKREKDKI